MFRSDLGTTINYQPYVSFRPWHNNQLSTVCFVQTLVQQSYFFYIKENKYSILSNLNINEYAEGK